MPSRFAPFFAIVFASLSSTFQKETLIVVRAFSPNLCGGRPVRTSVLPLLPISIIILAIFPFRLLLLYPVTFAHVPSLYPSFLASLHVHPVNHRESREVEIEE